MGVVVSGRVAVGIFSRVYLLSKYKGHGKRPRIPSTLSTPLAIRQYCHTAILPCYPNSTTLSATTTAVFFTCVTCAAVAHGEGVPRRRRHPNRHPHPPHPHPPGRSPLDLPDLSIGGHPDASCLGLEPRAGRGCVGSLPVLREWTHGGPHIGHLRAVRGIPASLAYSQSSPRGRCYPRRCPPPWMQTGIGLTGRCHHHRQRSHCCKTLLLLLLLLRTRQTLKSFPSHPSHSPS